MRTQTTGRFHLGEEYSEIEKKLKDEGGFRLVIPKRNYSDRGEQCVWVYPDAKANGDYHLAVARLYRDGDIEFANEDNINARKYHEKIRGILSKNGQKGALERRKAGTRIAQGADSKDKMSYPFSEAQQRASIIGCFLREKMHGSR